MPTPRFRQGSLDSETFALYSERYCWNITFCGAEALRVYNHDYLAQTADGKKYLLNMHIKYGVKVQELVLHLLLLGRCPAKSHSGISPRPSADIERPYIRTRSRFPGITETGSVFYFGKVQQRTNSVQCCLSVYSAFSLSANWLWYRFA